MRQSKSRRRPSRGRAAGLAENYLKSDVFRRVSDARRASTTSAGELAPEDHRLKSVSPPQSSPGLWSELRFRLRRPLGILTGTIDKLLITPAANGNGVDVEIIDFKTNRFSAASSAKAKRRATVVATQTKAVSAVRETGKVGSQPAQGFFNFEVTEEEVSREVEVLDDSGSEASTEAQVQTTAADYQLQMQAYVLALRELYGPVRINSLRATLHFIDPNVEVSLPAALLDHDACANAIDEAMTTIALLDGTLDADQFPPLPAAHCRICNFRDLCPAGRDYLRATRA